MASSYASQLEKISAFQDILIKVKTYVDASRVTFVEEQKQAIINVFPGLSETEMNSLLARFGNPSNWISSLVYKKTEHANVFATSYEIPLDAIELPSYTKNFLKKLDDIKPKIPRDMQVELQELKQVLRYPESSFQAPSLNSLFPKPNTLLAVQTMNKLAQHYGIRVEDVETVLREALKNQKILTPT